MKIIQVLILAICQVFLVLKWLVQMAWWLLVTLPWGVWQDARKWRAHECPKPQPVAVESFVPHTQPAPEPVSNDDGPGVCWMCEHPKEHHEDDFACQVPNCFCEMDQYSRPPVWHPGDPMQFHDRVVDLDGSISYVKVMV